MADELSPATAPQAEAEQTPTQTPEPAETPAPEATEPAAEAPAAKPVTVNHYNRRDDNDALPGHWVKVVAGEFAGRVGHFFHVVSHDEKTGYPDRVLVRTRDADNLQVEVGYDEIRPTDYTGGR